MATSLLDRAQPEPSRYNSGPKPLTEGRRPVGVLIALWVFVTIPFLALLVAIPVAWGGGCPLTDALIAVGFYLVSGFGVTVGFHRYFTHGSFKAKRPVRIMLAVAGLPGHRRRVIQWVADHRRHHAFTDAKGDPHSPWRYGASVARPGQRDVLRPLGWLFHRELTNRERFAPDLLADRDIRRVDRLFPLLVIISLLAPALLGRAADLVLAGRADRVLLGQAGPDRAAAPRHLVDQLGLPRVRRATVRHPQRRPGRQLLAAGDHLLRRELAQLAPRRPDLRPPRCPAGADRPVRPADLVLEKFGWVTTCGGRRRSG